MKVLRSDDDVYVSYAGGLPSLLQIQGRRRGAIVNYAPWRLTPKMQ
jgi:hypothetical protein